MGENCKAKSASEAMEHYYAHPMDPIRQGDEFIAPTQIIDENGEFSGAIEDGDSLIFFNFRGDRPREITRAFIQHDFQGFPRKKKTVDVFWAMLTEYEQGLC
jgi:2,3-bisphosphoglycerate-independent phosphoglycerate mutase